jgi:hypothetical protein
VIVGRSGGFLAAVRIEENPRLDWKRELTMLGVVENGRGGGDHGYSESVIAFLGLFYGQVSCCQEQGCVVSFN